ncbi:MAG: hypothetical protein KC766_07110 [Myxococcales bacterium]|nr:hypothetical protein [Myxococcales bacterium]
MKPWTDLYVAHRAARTITNTKWATELRRRLVALADAGHCDRSVQGLFTYRKDKDHLQYWSIRGSGGTSASIALKNLPGLASAELTLMACVNRDEHLHEFTVMVEGRRADSSTWLLAAHLPDDREAAHNPTGDRQGLGACGHAALHCHVGPDFQTAPEVRVPLPPLGPVETLDWVITQVLPTAQFEPAPWPAVKAALQKAN